MTSAEPTRRIEYVALDALEPATRNPKKHRQALITQSINRFGFVAPVLRDERTGRLVVGHGRLDALRELRDQGTTAPAGLRVDDAGTWQVPVVCGWASRSDAEADAYLVADNRHTELGGWDHPELAMLLADVAAHDPELLDTTGWDADELADLLKAQTPADLDQLADELGEPGDDDMWPTVRMRCAPHVAAAWRDHLDTHTGKENEAFAALLSVDPHWAPQREWTP